MQLHARPPIVFHYNDLTDSSIVVFKPDFKLPINLLFNKLLPYFNVSIAHGIVSTHVSVNTLYARYSFVYYYDYDRGARLNF